MQEFKSWGTIKTKRLVKGPSGSYEIKEYDTEISCHRLVPPPLIISNMTTTATTKRTVLDSEDMMFLVTISGSQGGVSASCWSVCSDSYFIYEDLADACAYAEMIANETVRRYEKERFVKTIHSSTTTNNKNTILYEYQVRLSDAPTEVIQRIIVRGMTVCPSSRPLFSSPTHMP